MLLLACILFFKSIVFSQTNLIQNCSFEEYQLPIDCNAGGFDNYSVSTPNHVVNSWNTFYSPDYYNSICTTGYFNVPHSRFGDSYPKNGNAYSGIICFSKLTEGKEYIYQQLSQPLEADTVYCLSFFTTKADRVTHAIKNLGAYFSPNIPTQTYYINAIPQVINNLGFITDTINWTEIKACFTAQGGEEYITIGNFNSNANTDTLNVGCTNQLSGTNGYGYYYIDSVSLWKNNFPTFIKENSNSEVVSVYPNPANEVINFKFKDATEKRKIELYDAIGELVLSEEASTQNTSLKTHQLKSGIYFYRILVNGIIVNTNKIVIIK